MTPDDAYTGPEVADGLPGRDLTERARAEAERRWPDYAYVGFSARDDQQAAFRAGAAWAAEQHDEVSDYEVRHRAAVEAFSATQSRRTHEATARAEAAEAEVARLRQGISAEIDRLPTRHGTGIDGCVPIAALKTIRALAGSGEQPGACGSAEPHAAHGPSVGVRCPGVPAPVVPDAERHVMAGEPGAAWDYLSPVVPDGLPPGEYRKGGVIGDPGSVLPRIPGESVTAWSARAVLAVVRPTMSAEHVERAARAAFEEAYQGADEQALHPWDTPWVKQTWLDIARATLTAVVRPDEQARS